MLASKLLIAGGKMSVKLNSINVRYKNLALRTKT